MQIECQNCHSKNKNDAKFCRKCGNQLGESSNVTEKNTKELPQIGGWLAYLTVGIAISFLYSIYNAYQYILLYESFSRSTVRVAIILSTLFVVLAVIQLVTLILIRKRHKLAKSVAIATLITNMLVYTVDAVMNRDLANQLSISLPQDYYQGVYRSILLGFIWIIYLLTSKRVKRTFIYTKNELNVDHEVIKASSVSKEKIEVKPQDLEQAQLSIIRLGFKEVNNVNITDEDIEKLPHSSLKHYYSLGLKQLSNKAGDID